MKFYTARAGFLLVASFATAFAAAAVPARGFGPGNCVSVTRSDGGTCMLSTNCPEQDVSTFDFSFLCVMRPAGREIHSLGVGSFDQVEEFDTEVRCDECLPPVVGIAAKSAVQAPSRVPSSDMATTAKTKVPVLKGAAKPGNRTVHSTAASLKASQLRAGGPVKKAASFLEKDSHAEGKPGLESEEEPDDDVLLPDIPEKAEHYGPASCVAVWRNQTTGHCVMQTDCEEPAALSVYEFGLVCVDQDTKMTKHVFGMDSFKLRERFDTLIECKECLALDEYTNGNKAIKQLANEIQEMEGDLANVGMGVTRLNAAVMKEKEEAAPAPAPAPAAAAAPSEPTAKSVMFSAERDAKVAKVGKAEEEEDATESEGEEEADASASEASEEENAAEAVDEETGEKKDEEDVHEEVVGAEEEALGADEDAAGADEEAEESKGEAEQQEKTAPVVRLRRQEKTDTATVGFFRKARHHKHQEVRRVRRRHVVVKTEEDDDGEGDTPEAESSEEENGDDAASRSEERASERWD